MQIGRVAHETGLTVDAIRFYERRGLLARASRSAGGFRVYGEAELDNLRFIRRIYGLGFTLREVRELVRLRGAHPHACAAVRERLAEKRAEVLEKIRELESLNQELARALRRCDRQLRRKGNRCTECPVLSEPSPLARRSH
jgi:DNA-binding transcriptional MerR regulator